MQTLEHHSSHLEQKLTTVQKEQLSILNNFTQLENRYKEIIRENQQIKNELLDLRKNRQGLKGQSTSKKNATPDTSFNLPLQQRSQIQNSQS